MMDSSKGRRRFLVRAGSVAMASGLAAGYGSCGVIGVRYVYPPKSGTARLFVSDLASFADGKALDYELPSGAKVTIARQGTSGMVADFVALSSTCPHLGCRVHWEGARKRFFCPCHSGVFDASGKPVSGPPKADDTPLSRYPLVIEGGLLFIEIDEEAPA